MLIVFDFDGTLADSFASMMEIFNELAPRFRLRPIADVARARLTPTRRLLREMGVTFWKLPRIVRAYREAAAQHCGSLKLHEGLGEVLSQLHSQGHRLGILSTNHEDNIRNCLRANGVEDYFAFVVGHPKLFGKGKVLRGIVKSEQANRDDVIYIGDEMRDLEAGRKARIATIAVSWGFQDESLLVQARPTHLVREPGELLALLTRATGR